MKSLYPAAVPLRVDLPPSKSMAARAMFIDAVRGYAPAAPSGADCDDLRVLKTALIRLLAHRDAEINLEASGTAMRFLTAFCAATPALRARIRGCARLEERPMAPLIASLRGLGADVECLGAPDCLPLEVRGVSMQGGEVRIDASVSSQFVSALLLVAPAMERELTLRYPEGCAPPSQPYVDMTVRMMRAAGALVQPLPDGFRVAPGGYPEAPPHPEADWSAAAAVYACVALAPEGTEGAFERLTPPERSAQGDSACASLFARIGVLTEFNASGGATIRRCSSPHPDTGIFEADMRRTPDLVPSLAVALAMRGIPFRFEGVGHLRYKESDRVAELAAGLRLLLPDFGEECRPDSWSVSPGATLRNPGATPIHTAADHRIAMAFAPAAMRVGPLRLDDYECVGKSFPRFFEAVRPLISQHTLTLH